MLKDETKTGLYRKKFSEYAQKISHRIHNNKIACTLCQQKYYPGWQCPKCERFLCETCSAFVYRIRDQNYKCFYCDYKEGPEPLSPFAKEFFKKMNPNYLLASMTLPAIASILKKTGISFSGSKKRRERRKKLKLKGGLKL